MPHTLQLGSVFSSVECRSKLSSKPRVYSPHFLPVLWIAERGSASVHDYVSSLQKFQFHVFNNRSSIIRDRSFRTIIQPPPPPRDWPLYHVRYLSALSTLSSTDVTSCTLLLSNCFPTLYLHVCTVILHGTVHLTFKNSFGNYFY